VGEEDEVGVEFSSMNQWQKKINITAKQLSSVILKRKIGIPEPGWSTFKSKRRES